MPLLGIIAATIANTTPAAAGIVYFPVLTQLSITPLTTVRFTQMIQAYGMGLGTLKWYLVNSRLFLWQVLPLCIVCGVCGTFAGLVLFPLKNPEILKFIFNIVSFVLVQFVFVGLLFKREYNQLKINDNWFNLSLLAVVSIFGGMISGWIGFGVDTMVYFILTIFFRVNIALAIITSISLMTACSIAATVINFSLYDMSGVTPLWFSALPGVTLAGLFLASYFAMRLGTRTILLLFSLCLSVEFFIAVWTQEVIPLGFIARFVITNVMLIYLAVVHMKVFKSHYRAIDAPPWRGKSEF